MGGPISKSLASGGHVPPLAEVSHDNGVALLLTAGAAAALCSVSERTWRRKDASGEIPAAVRLGGSKRWKRDEVEAWVAADCPPRDLWCHIQNNAGRHRTGTSAQRPRR